MNQTYSAFSEICTKFYDLVYDPAHVARFVLGTLAPFQLMKSLFIGGFFLVAHELVRHGLDLTVCDYSDDMVLQGISRLPSTRVMKADLRDLPFENQLDSIFVIGRVFTHMLTNDDARSALGSLQRSLKNGGVVFMDNYEDSKIRETDYFNGRITVSNSNIEIVRDSSTEFVSEQPYIVNWSAEYRWKENGRVGHFKDQMLHRAFSRRELAKMLEKNGLTVVTQGDNFDDTSFYTLATKTALPISHDLNCSQAVY